MGRVSIWKPRGLYDILKSSLEAQVTNPTSVFGSGVSTLEPVPLIFRSVQVRTALEPFLSWVHKIWQPQVAHGHNSRTVSVLHTGPSSPGV